MTTIPGTDNKVPHSMLGVRVEAWLRENLFSTWYNSALTAISVVLVGAVLWYGLKWAIFDANWGVISTLGGLMVVGRYNVEAACPDQNCLWRPQVSLLLVTALFGMGWGIAGGGLTRRIAIGVAVAVSAFALLPYGLDTMGMDVRLLLAANLPAVLAGWALARYTPMGSPKWLAVSCIVVFLLILLLLRGVSQVPGLQPVPVTEWGGLMLNLLLAVIGIAGSLPIGIGLALGRRSKLPVVKSMCVVFIEVFRGVPLITLLFMSVRIVPLAFPENFPLNPITSAAVVITLFSSAYMAENIRGGLQALHAGQAEASRALGLAGWQTMMLISLPQAIRNVIPAIVGQFISLFKDTSLVYIISLQDVVGISRAFIRGNVEFLASHRELYIFLALVFWVFTYGMSYVSRRIEQNLRVGER